MKKILSIVVPAYNAQEYLRECLESFFVDDIMDDIEILIVNDGSTDETLNIAQEYRVRYPNSIRVFDKANGGHGSGINYGIQYATGYYFKVVDSDDLIEKKYFSEYISMLKQCREKQIDVVASDFITFEDGTGKLIKKWPATGKESNYGQAVSLRQGQVDRCIKMHHMTIRTAILQEHGIVIDEHHFYVDMEYVTYPVPYIDTVYYDPHVLYRYRLGRAGQTMRPEVMIRNKERHRFVMEQLLKFYDTCGENQKQQQITDEQLAYIAKCIAQMVESHFQIYISIGWKKGLRKQLRDWDLTLKTQYPQVYHATRKRSIDMLRKTNYMILPLGTVIYRIVK